MTNMIDKLDGLYAKAYTGHVRRSVNPDTVNLRRADGSWMLGVVHEGRIASWAGFDDPEPAELYCELVNAWPGIARALRAAGECDCYEVLYEDAPKPCGSCAVCQSHAALDALKEAK